MVLVVRTDADAMIGLYDGVKLVSEKTWQAGRELSGQLLSEIKTLLSSNGVAWEQLDKIVFFEGPGSYTSLRIGASVVNALGYSYQIPVVAVKGETWLDDGLQAKTVKNGFMPVVPFYGGNARVTAPKK